MPAPVPANEEARLEALRRYRILETGVEKAFDDITALAAEVCETPISILSFIDKDRQWFKSAIGVQVKESSREISLCAHAILQDDVFIVPDTLADERFAQNPLVTGEPRIRFYAGVPLVNSEGFALGTLCVIDRVPRELTEQQKDKIRALAHGAMMLLEVRRREGSQE